DQRDAGIGRLACVRLGVDPDADACAVRDRDAVQVTNLQRRADFRLLRRWAVAVPGLTIRLLRAAVGRHRLGAWAWAATPPPGRRRLRLLLSWERQHLLPLRRELRDR